MTHDLPTERIDDAPAMASTPGTLLVLSRHGVDRVALQRDVTLIIGREPPADVLVADGSLSRQHARLHVDREGQLLIEDLESTNGTIVNGARVSRAAVRPGDRVALGAASLVVQLGADEQLARTLEGHDRFVARLEEEVQRARTFRRGCALLMIAAEPGAHVGAWGGNVAQALRAVDRLGLYAADCLELLLAEASPDEARAKAASLAQRLPRVTISVSCYPAQATSAAALLARCREALQRGRGPGVVEPRGAEPPTPHEQPPVPGARLAAMLEEADRFAAAAVNVLILGETGAGKEVVARRIHQRSPRAAGPFRALNCGALPATLVESTLFGHERGAFTGADARQAGLFEAASGGTLLLDEIGELPPPAQAALLRALDSKRITRVGSSEELAVDVRVLAATHRDVEALVAEGAFRQDLLYRLNTVVLEVPPLRERTDELPALARHLVSAAARSNRRPVPAMDDEALELLLAHTWPGNVRELRNALERAVVICVDGVITAEDLPASLRRPARDQAPAPPIGDEEQLDFKALVQRYERELIIAALRACDWNQSAAARRLRIPRRTLVHKMRSLGLRKLGYAAPGGEGSG